MRVVLLALSLFVGLELQAQFTESFTDGELNNNPAWIYNSNDFEVFSGRLKTLNANGGSVKYGISSLYNAASDQRFEFTFQFQFNPSSQNYAEFYISADTTAELARNGYFIRCGDLKDEISFYRLSNGARTELISGTDGELNKTNNHYSVRLDRNNDTFILYYKTNTASVWSLQGKYYEPAFAGGKYTGLHIVQNGTSVIGKHFFDDVYLGPKVTDTMPPRMFSTRFVFPDKVEVQFNEAINNPDTLHFSLNGGIGRPASATTDPVDNSKVMLTFKSALPLNQALTLSNVNTPDQNGNVAKLHSIGVFTLKADIPGLNDLFITEVMANPTPKTGSFPEAEYVEIWNPTNKYLKLAGCRFSDASSSVVLPDSVISPHTYVTISRNTFPGFAAFGPWIGLSSLPSLNNDEDFLSISNPSGETICRLNYKETWHSDALRKAGGWSLELIDTVNACISAGNWSSNRSSGGTPGQPNSLKGLSITVIQPKVYHVFCNDAGNETSIFFSHPPDSITAADMSNYELIDGTKPLRFNGFTTDGYGVKIQWPGIFSRNRVLQMKIRNILLCNGTAFPEQWIEFGRADSSDLTGSLKLNEVLFDPRGEGADYVEIGNTGDAIVYTGNGFFITLDEKGAISGSVKLPENRNLLPGEYLVLTENPDLVKQQFTRHNAAAFSLSKPMPTMSNTDGHIGLADKFGNITDTFKYKDDYHSPVLADKEGVSLEKINPAFNSSLSSNWTSASHVSGFGTPGLQNSQWRGGTNTTARFSRAEKFFSPDNDGLHDVFSLDYSLPGPGYYVTATVFTAEGFKTAVPFNNISLNQSGTLNWDGNTESGVIRPGIYVMFIEAWNAQGEKIREKLSFSVNAR